MKQKAELDLVLDDQLSHLSHRLRRAEKFAKCLKKAKRKNQRRAQLREQKNAPAPKPSVRQRRRLRKAQRGQKRISHSYAPNCDIVDTMPELGEEESYFARVKVHSRDGASCAMFVDDDIEPVPEHVMLEDHTVCLRPNCTIEDDPTIDDDLTEVGMGTYKPVLVDLGV